MPAHTSCSSESRFHRGSEWGKPCLEPSPQSWLLTYLLGHLPSTFSVEAGAPPPSTQHRSPISRNAKFASSALLSSGSTVGRMECMILDWPPNASALVFARLLVVSGGALKLLTHPLLEGRRVLRTTEQVLHQVIGRHGSARLQN